MRYIKCLAVGLALSGCASITRGTTEDVNILVDPTDASITSTVGHTCTGIPCKLNVARKTEFSVTATKVGYKPETVFVSTGFSGGGAAGIAGNVLIGGVIGVGVDAITGATLNHSPNPVLMALQPLDAKNKATPAGSRSALEACSKIKKEDDPLKCLADAKAKASAPST